jgi:hypothetical protein
MCPVNYNLEFKFGLTFFFLLSAEVISSEKDLVIGPDCNLLIVCKCTEAFHQLSCRHVHWKNAFPLYDKDYNLVLEAIGKMEKNLPGFFYAGM